MNTDYKAALQTVRRMLNENFYGMNMLSLG